MKKRILSVLLALVMALSLCTVALAEPTDGDDDSVTIDTIAFTLTGYNYGAVGGIGVTCATNATNPDFPGVSASATIVTYGGSEVGWSAASMPLREGTQHYVAKVVYSAIQDEGCVVGDNVVPTMTCNGVGCQLLDADNHTSTAAPTLDNNGEYTAYFALPELTAVNDTKTINFIKTVVKGGNVEPPVTTFTFEQVTNTVTVIAPNDNIQVPSAPQVTVTIDPIESGETGGNGNYLGTIKVTGSQIDLEQFLRNGFYVREKNGNAENWTYDEQVWFLQLKDIHSDTDNVATDLGETALDGQQDFQVVAKKVVKSDNTYVPADGAKWCYPQSGMIFTNTYTAYRTAHRNPTPTEKIEAPKTFDAGIAVYGVSALLSLTGSAWVVTRRRDR